MAAKVAAASNSRPFLFLRTGIEAKGEGARRVALLTVGQKLADGGVLAQDWDDLSSSKRKAGSTAADQVFTEEELALMDIGDA